MKRPLLIIAVCLLVGAVVNVAVAWACVTWVLIHPEGWLLPEGEQVEFWHGPSRARKNVFLHATTIDQAGTYRVICAWPAKRWRDFMSGPRWPTGLVRDRADQSIRRWVCMVVADEMTRAEDGLVIIDARGWPLRALYVVGDPVEKVISGGVPLPAKRHSWFLSAYALPCRPIWPAFLVNTIFYATLLWLLIPGPFALRRVLRVRRGLCPKCAYPMGESSVCTECGGVLRSTAVALKHWQPTPSTGRTLNPSDAHA